MKQLAILLAFIGLIGCSGYDKTTATIRDYGPVAADGCGWVVQLSDSVYKPQEELPEAFQIDSLEVEIKYKVLSSRAPCGFNLNAFAEIDLKSIE